MQSIWTFIEPHITGALSVLLPAAVALAVAWMRARQAKLEAERQAALGAVCEINALTQERQPMGNTQKKLVAMHRMAARLPGQHKLDPARIAQRIEEAVATEKQQQTARASAGFEDRPTNKLPEPAGVGPLPMPDDEPRTSPEHPHARRDRD